MESFILNFQDFFWLRQNQMSDLKFYCKFFLLIAVSVDSCEQFYLFEDGDGRYLLSRLVDENHHSMRFTYSEGNHFSSIWGSDSK